MGILGDAFKIFGAIKGSKAKKKADKENKQIAAENMKREEERFASNRQDSLEDLLRMIAETKGINEDLIKQRGNTEQDVRGLRQESKDVYEALLAEVLGQQDVQMKEPGEVAGMSDRAAARERQGRDATDAASRIKGYEDELSGYSPSAAELTALLRSQGAGATSRAYDKNRNTAALQLTRTGGNGDSLFAEMAADQAAALRDNDVNAILQGITGAEQLKASRASRLNPIINSLSARSTVQPSLQEETAVRGQNMEFENAKALNAIRGASNVAGLAPAAMRFGDFRMPEIRPLAATGGRNMSYAGAPAAQNRFSKTPDYGSALLMQGFGDMADKYEDKIAGLFTGGMGGSAGTAPKRSYVW